MLGLFGSLNMGRRSLQAQQQSLEVVGHNLANASNPAYARQRARVETSTTLPSNIGIQGTGVNVTMIEQIRSSLIDRQVATEVSTAAYWENRQSTLTSMEGALGQEIDRHASGAEGAAAALGIGGQQGIAEGIQKFFAALQSVSTDPTSMAERQILLQQSAALAEKFNNTSDRLVSLNTGVNDALSDHVSQANTLLGSIARLNDQITTAEVVTTGKANDLRDLRQQKVEELSELLRAETTESATGAIDVSVGGVLLVSANSQFETLTTHDPGDGQLVLRASGGTVITTPGGNIQGDIDTRDGTLATLRRDIDTLASELISQVNSIHSTGYGLSGGTGQDFFTGTGAGDIGVNTVLTNNPGSIQASAENGAIGNNEIVLRLSQLADAPQSALSNQTFSESFSRTVSGLGQELANANAQVSDNAAVKSMLLRQRDSLSGVSVDEEMTDLVKFQRAYQASAKFINTIDEMLQTILSLK
ncbi:MAG: flagellar hook-associated protein 1 FlgK [Limisphaerales bacterium]|jgi:flagellar hook-associated protein 1 FlgK